MDKNAKEIIYCRHSKAEPKDSIFSGFFTTTLLCLFKMTVTSFASALLLSVGIVSEVIAFDCSMSSYSSAVICVDADGKTIFEKRAGSGWNYDETTNTYTSNGGSKIVVDDSNNSIKYNTDGKTVDYDYQFNSAGNVTQIKYSRRYDSLSATVDYKYDNNGNYNRFISGSNYNRAISESGDVSLLSAYYSDYRTGKYAGCSTLLFDSNGNQEIKSYNANGHYIGSSYTDADGNPLDGLVWDSYSDRIGEFDNGSLTSWTGGYYTNGFYTYCENDTTPCTGKTIAFRPDGNGGFSKMTCTDSSLTNCTTTQYNNKGKVIAEYDADNKLITMNDYADNGNKLVYNDQCELVARYDAEGNELAMPYRIGDGLKASDRHVLYTLPEAASIIKNSNDNSLIMYFK